MDSTRPRIGASRPLRATPVAVDEAHLNDLLARPHISMKGEVLPGLAMLAGIVVFFSGLEIVTSNPDLTRATKAVILILAFAVAGAAASWGLIRTLHGSSRWAILELEDRGASLDSAAQAALAERRRERIPILKRKALAGIILIVLAFGGWLFLDLGSGLSGFLLTLASWGIPMGLGAFLELDCEEEFRLLEILDGKVVSSFHDVFSVLRARAES